MSRLTGRFNFRKTWRGRLSLDVEEEYQSHWGGEKRRWRKANLADLAEPEMRALVDLRFQRQFRGRVADPIQASDPPSPGPKGTRAQLRLQGLNLVDRAIQQQRMCQSRV